MTNDNIIGMLIEHEHDLIRYGDTNLFQCNSCGFSVTDDFICWKCGHDKTCHSNDEYECVKSEKKCRCKNYEPRMMQFQRSFQYG